MTASLRNHIIIILIHLFTTFYLLLIHLLSLSVSLSLSLSPSLSTLTRCSAPPLPALYVQVSVLSISLSDTHTHLHSPELSLAFLVFYRLIDDRVYTLAPAAPQNPGTCPWYVDEMEEVAVKEPLGTQSLISTGDESSSP